jgi:hypothetical protein
MEPLATDEKLEAPRAKERDMDTHMLFGCTGFVVSSFATYFLTVWPFFVWMEVHQWGLLLKALLCGLPVAFLHGFLSTLKFELAGAAGFIGGMLAAVIFLYLRFEQVFLEAAARRIPEPDYPLWIKWFVPALVLAFALLTVAAAYLLRTSMAERAKKR